MPTKAANQVLAKSNELKDIERQLYSFLPENEKRSPIEELNDGTTHLFMYESQFNGIVFSAMSSPIETGLHMSNTCLFVIRLKDDRMPKHKYCVYTFEFFYANIDACGFTGKYANYYKLENGLPIRIMSVGASKVRSIREMDERFFWFVRKHLRSRSAVSIVTDNARIRKVLAGVMTRTELLGLKDDVF